MKLRCLVEISARTDSSNWLRRRRSRHSRISCPTGRDPAVTVMRPDASRRGRLRAITPEGIDAMTRPRRGSGHRPPNRGVHHVRPDRPLPGRLNEADPARRRTLLAETFAPGWRLVDPLVDVHGLDAVDATIAAVQSQFPGVPLYPVGDADAHHDVVRFRWGLGQPGEEPIVLGFDVLTVDGQGRITSVIGFLDRVPVS